MAVTHGVWIVAVDEAGFEFEVFYNFSRDVVPDYSPEKTYYILVETIDGLKHKVLATARGCEASLGIFQGVKLVSAVE